MKNKTYRRPRSSAAPVDRARLPRPSTAPDLVPTTTRLPVHCVATRRRKIRSTFQNINEVCMKNKTYPRPANQRPLPLALRRPSRRIQTKGWLKRASKKANRATTHPIFPDAPPPRKMNHSASSPSIFVVQCEMNGRREKCLCCARGRHTNQIEKIHSRAHEESGGYIQIPIRTYLPATVRNHFNRFRS